MFVVFEGIDGSGKTTVSNRVADALRARGVAVEHVRAGGEFASPLVARMREFGKDVRNLAMSPLCELLYYTAREVQLLDEVVRPALDRSAVVFADRYLYSCEVLSAHGRGVPEAQVTPIVDAASGGLWPDLVVLLDVDPYIARARRKVTKIVRKAKGEALGPGSRKSLWGTGLQHRMRAGYLALARREPERWLVVDNADPRADDAALDAVVARVTEAIAAAVAGGRAVADVVKAFGPGERTAATGAGGGRGGADPGGADPRPESAARPEPSARPGASAWAARAAVRRAHPRERPGDLASGRDAFYARIEARAVREPKVAAYFLAGLADDDAYALRARLLDHAPHVIAHGLRGMGDDRAWALRDALIAQTPRQVARSLDGPGVSGPRADAMRAALAERHAAVVLGTISGEDTAAAWALRDRFADRQLARVVASLKQLDGDRAWALRERYMHEIDRDGVSGRDDPDVVSPLVVSLRGLDSQRAWALRRRLLDACPGQVLASLAGVLSDQAWDLRERYARQAPRIVLGTIEGVETPRAWALRRAHAPMIKESLDSMVGLDSEPAWALREACRDVWPSTVVKSLGPLARSPRGERLAMSQLVRYPDNISLLKHVARLCAPAANTGNEDADCPPR